MILPSLGESLLHARDTFQTTSLCDVMVVLGRAVCPVRYKTENSCYRNVTLTVASFKADTSTQELSARGRWACPLWNMESSEQAGSDVPPAETVRCSEGVHSSILPRLQGLGSTADLRRSAVSEQLLVTAQRQVTAMLGRPLLCSLEAARWIRTQVCHLSSPHLAFRSLPIAMASMNIRVGVYCDSGPISAVAYS